jgi:hypothetical protein
MGVTNKPEVLTPEIPGWFMFVSLLDRPLTDGCTPIEWHCDGGVIDTGKRAYRYAKRVMGEMGDVDIDGSIEFFRFSREHPLKHQWILSGCSRRQFL